MCVPIKYSWSIALIFMNLFKIYVYARINHTNYQMLMITAIVLQFILLRQTCGLGECTQISAISKELSIRKFINIFPDYLTAGENMKCHTLLPFAVRHRNMFFLAFLKRWEWTRKHFAMGTKWCKFKIQIQFQMKYHFWY